MSKLYLIDGHSLIFRMYYAFMRRPMINSKGQDTSIIYGFTKYLLELIRREQPTHIAVMFDPPAKTFRHEMCSDYKATRPAAPELVKEALEPLTQLVSALNIPVLMQPGFEADDVIGTVAKQCAGEDMDVYMVTPDKDLGQIIDTHIFQYKPGKSGADNEIVSKESLCEKFGICDPLQIIDILAIWGDTADNVKGISGVGEVGAKKLIGKYGSMENLIAHRDEQSPKLKQAIIEAESHLALSKQLVTIKTDVHLDYSIDDLKVAMPDNERISALFNLYEFNSLKNLLPQGGTIIEEKKKELSIEECDLHCILGMAEKEGKIAIRFSQNLVLAVGNHYCRTTAAEAVPILKNTDVSKLGFNLKNDLQALWRRGIEVTGELLDAEILHYILNPERSHKLEHLASSYLDIELNGSEKPDGMLMFDFDDMAVVKECVAVALIVPTLVEEVEKAGMSKLYREIEMPLIEVLADMEAAGVRIDCRQLAQYSATLTGELAEIENRARTLAEEPSLNLSSPKQVGTVIFEKLVPDSKVKKTSGGSYPTDEETLREFEGRHPFIHELLEYRALKKLLSTYIDPLPTMVDPRTGRLHTTFNQALTATGRLSSSGPNLQNIPIRTERGMKIRESFVPGTENGYIISADYSQIELRIMAHLSADQGMVEGFVHEADVHRATAARIFHKESQDVTPEERRRAKVANFGIIYGISAFGLSQRMGISRSESKSFIEEYFKSYPGIKNYIDTAILKARELGYAETIFGRKRYLPDINSRNQNVRGLAERNAVNAPVQGSSADIIKLAMVAVYREMKKAGLRSKMILQVHDELIFDVLPEELDALMKIVKKEMESVCTLSVPLTVECNYGKNWKEAH